MVLECGDIILIDSNKFGPRIVKFFMTAPTVWQYIWRAIRGTQQQVRYYHAAMALDNLSMIEQQRHVQISSLNKIKTNFVVYRNKLLTEVQKQNLRHIAIRDLTEDYDLWLILGKFLTWLTGIKFFVRTIQGEDEEICVTRVGYWYLVGIGERFGKYTWHELTTDVIDDYCSTHPGWEKVT